MAPKHVLALLTILLAANPAVADINCPAVSGLAAKTCADGQACCAAGKEWTCIARGSSCGGGGGGKGTTSALPTSAETSAGGSSSAGPTTTGGSDTSQTGKPNAAGVVEVSRLLGVGVGVIGAGALWV